MIRATVMTTPIGPLSLLARDGVLVGAGFTPEPKDLYGRLHAGLRDDDLEIVDDLGTLSERVRAYFDGDLAALDTLQVRQVGTPLRERLWEALRRVPAGQTVTYGELAVMAGRPGAARVAGGACASNLIAPIVPCHRVVPAAGGLGGYYYGLDHKRRLLEHEGALVPSA
ncbi:MAG: methylated-DNA--[protein]-cysteine S-methyltransferase [Streptosporangiales bacterium]|nr:methylated-DNA--[protein]-cysteine S-methyltransferase [Streptosporangiales bacterium]